MAPPESTQQISTSYTTLKQHPRIHCIACTHVPTQHPTLFAHSKCHSVHNARAAALYRDGPLRGQLPYMLADLVSGEITGLSQQSSTGLPLKLWQNSRHSLSAVTKALGQTHFNSAYTTAYPDAGIHMFSYRGCTLANFFRRPRLRWSTACACCTDGRTLSAALPSC